MFAPRWILLVCGIAALNFGGTLAGQTDQGAAASPDAEAQAKFAEPDCPFFGAGSGAILHRRPAAQVRNGTGAPAERHHERRGQDAGLRPGRQPHLQFRPGARGRVRSIPTSSPTSRPTASPRRPRPPIGSSSAASRWTSPAAFRLPTAC